MFEETNKLFKNIIIITLFLVINIVHVQVNGQSENIMTFLNGKVIDKMGVPIQYANILDSISHHGTTTDINGQFAIEIQNLPTKIIITHIGFETKTYNVEKKHHDLNDILTIKLNNKIVGLKEIEINSQKTKLAYNNKKAWVIDYELLENEIFLITTESNQKKLIVLDINHDTIAQKNISRNNLSLFKDCFDNILLINKDSVSQVHNIDGDVKLLFPHTITDFRYKLKPIQVATKEHYIYSRYSNFNQTIIYYLFNIKIGEEKILSEISDEKQYEVNNSYSVQTKNFIANSHLRMGDISDPGILGEFRDQYTDYTFFKKILSNPIYNPLKLINNNLFLFAFNEDKIYQFDTDGVFIKIIPINFHKTKGWDNEIIVDISLDKCYSKFITNGIVTLREIDLVTGKAKKSIRIDNYTFPENLRINKSRIYFMSSNNSDLYYLNKRYLYYHDIN